MSALSLAQAEDLARQMPALLAAAKHLATGLTHGLHGVRASGMGENFWQYRRFAPEDSAARIDWRRSAREPHLHVRETQRDVAQSYHLFIDVSASMQTGTASKRERALLLGLALTQLLLQNGDRVGLLGLTPPSQHRRTVEHIAHTLVHLPHHQRTSLPPLHALPRTHRVLFIADFLDPAAQWQTYFEQLSAQTPDLAPHCVMVLDPTEENFPFTGSIEFSDPESARRLLIKDSASIRAAYQARLHEHKQQMHDMIHRAHGTLLLHHTDQPAAPALLALLMRLAARQER